MTERKKISFAHGQELTPDDAPALPLWIDGHAYLLLADQFHDVRDAAGRVLRRVPLYGDDAVALAVPSVQRGLVAWQATGIGVRDACFRQLHELVGRYRGHLAKLVAEESGLSHALAEAELEQALAMIAGVVAQPFDAGDSRRVAAVLGDALTPLAGPLECAVEALNAGWGVVLKPSPKAPSALFAVAELFTRAGFPKGVVNCVHGDEQAVRALCHHAGVSAIAFTGAQTLVERIGRLAAETGCPYAGGAPDGRLQAAWRICLGRPV